MNCIINRFYLLFLISVVFHYGPSVKAQNNVLVFQSDFGLKDGAVAAMKGVALSVSPDLKMFDLTHEIPPFNIWEAAYRLNQTAMYWPSGTVFVSVVDPGVGSTRRSIVMKSKSGHYFVTPDNGTLTLIAESLGVAEAREIDPAHRMLGSNESYTFHGRDVYAFTGARLAAGLITFEQVGKKLKGDIVNLPYQKASYKDNVITGTVDILDIQYGNVWTNINRRLLDQLNIQYGDSVKVKIFHDRKLVYEGKILYATTFSSVKEGQPVAYLNSLLNFSLGLNMDSFAGKNNIGSGPEWTIVVFR